ncbi:MAG: hypothetical protein HY870_16375 [Chloroflexi bacterium]|nr:hypothetical protein [Chloroflexota bacterium]
MDSDNKTLTVLLVMAVQQIFGVPAIQIERLAASAADSLEDKTTWWPLALGLGYASSDVVDRRATHILWTRNGIGWAVESILELSTLPIHSVRRLPALLAQHTARVVWGAAFYEGDLILLVDLDQIACPPLNQH